MNNYESEMVDEMLQAALNLNVEEEIENRMNIARKGVEEGSIGESGSKSLKKQSASKKNVTFQSPKNKDKFSSSNYS